MSAIRFMTRKDDSTNHQDNASCKYAEVAPAARRKCLENLLLEYLWRPCHPLASLAEEQRTPRLPHLAASKAAQARAGVDRSRSGRLPP